MQLSIIGVETESSDDNVDWVGGEEGICEEGW